jgi:hypothetical protein
MTTESLNRPLPDPEQGSLELTEKYIRLRAYFLYEERGREDGHDVEDWVRAEAEIVGRKPSVAAPEEPETPRAAAVRAAA